MNNSCHELSRARSVTAVSGERKGVRESKKEEGSEIDRQRQADIDNLSDRDGRTERQINR